MSYIDLIEFANARAALPDNGVASRGEFCVALRLDPAQVHEYANWTFAKHIEALADEAPTAAAAMKAAIADVFLAGLLLGTQLAAVPREDDG